MAKFCVCLERKFLQCNAGRRAFDSILTLGVAGEDARGEILYYGGWAYGVSMTAIKFLKN
jgi:hypothetical protein